MGRLKGSVNKKKELVQLEIQETQEVNMSQEVVLEGIEQEIDMARLELEKTRREIAENKQALENMKASAQAPVVRDVPAVSVSGQGLSEKIAAQKKIDNELVTGKFYNLRAKGQPKKLPYHKYADDPIKWYSFEHGGTYTIPRGFADQINEYYHTPHFIQKTGADMIITDPENPDTGIASVDKSDKMYSFVPLNF